MPWRALTLELAAAQAETLSDALVAQGAQSVWIGTPGRARLQLYALFDAGADPAALLGAAATAAGCALPSYRAYDVADEDWVRATHLRGARVLDYGCGSGILAIAAARLGAARVDGVDLDADALGATSDNARANGVAVGAFAPERLPPGDYDVVVANILAQPLTALEPLIAARTRPGGRVALSGILEAQAAKLAAAYDAHFAARIAAREARWALVEGVRR